MRPLPRLFAFTDQAIRRHPHAGAIAAAIASVGPPVGIVAHDHTASGAELTTFASVLLAHARPVEASLFVAGRPDIAAAIGANGVHLRAGDLSPTDTRTLMPHAWIGCSVHTAVEGATAVEEGADFLVAGNVFETRGHPERPVAGLNLIETLASLGRPVIAIGGITADTVWAVKHAGAYGVAAHTALWQAQRPAQVALTMLEPWM